MNIVITGASSGIGREVALRLAGESQNRIYAVARSIKALQSLADGSENGNIIPVIMDITRDR
ncbi:MAG: SDR family NAD(P)-dependent oxidoreductase, partial [Bacteroidales bacterium]|nr:SDR family NAD(P)-dependent oxidoreductase [Bacteroidales bacterium]